MIDYTVPWTLSRLRMSCEQCGSDELHDESERLIIEVLKSHKNKSNIVLSAEMTRQMLTQLANLGVGWDCGLGINIVNLDGMTRFGPRGVERRLSQHVDRLPGNWTRSCLDD